MILGKSINKVLNMNNITRRKFLGEILPIIGGLIVSVMPVIGQTPSYCKGACTQNCYKSCAGTHETGCAQCSNQCLKSCKATCKGYCNFTCTASCIDTCNGACYSTCYGSCAGSSYKVYNDSINIIKDLNL